MFPDKLAIFKFLLVHFPIQLILITSNVWRLIVTLTYNSNLEALKNVWCPSEIKNCVICINIYKLQNSLILNQICFLDFPQKSSMLSLNLKLNFSLSSTLVWILRKCTLDDISCLTDKHPVSVSLLVNVDSARLKYFDLQSKDFKFHSQRTNLPAILADWLG